MNLASAPSRAERAYLLLSAIFVASLVLTNLTAGKFFNLFGYGLSCGILAYPITFLATDLICEVFGKKRATYLVATGFVVSLFVTALVWLAVQVPVYTTPEGNYIGINPTEFAHVFGLTPGIVFGSMVAYLTAQFVDVQIFHFWKRLTKGRHLWLRNNASTFVSQLVDTMMVISVTLVVWPRMFPDSGVQAIDSFSQWREMVLTGYVFKAVVAALDTPLFYVGARWLKSWIDRDPGLSSTA